MPSVPPGTRGSDPDVGVEGAARAASTSGTDGIDRTDAVGGAGGFSRAYLHHLERCGEMLAPMLATIHNLHYYLQLMRELRAALDAGGFEDWRRQFHADRQRGVS
jgi:queuine tRNA-ribosyltransferase